MARLGVGFVNNLEILADVRAYDAAKARLEAGEDELVPLAITERKLSGEPALRIWREHRKLTALRGRRRCLGHSLRQSRRSVRLDPSAHGGSSAPRWMWDGSNWRRVVISSGSCVGCHNGSLPPVDEHLHVWNLVIPVSDDPQLAIKKVVLLGSALLNQRLRHRS
jgi:hypothetical protein